MIMIIIMMMMMMMMMIIIITIIIIIIIIVIVVVVIIIIPDEPDRRCYNMLRGLQRNPPSNTRISINIRLSKARYRCRKGFVLVGKEMRTCRKGRWTEKKEPQCVGTGDTLCFVPVKRIFIALFYGNMFFAFCPLFTA